MVRVYKGPYFTGGWANRLQTQYQGPLTKMPGQTVEPVPWPEEPDDPEEPDN